MDSSAPTILLRSQVRIPCTTSALLYGQIVLNIWHCNEKRTEINKKRPSLAHIFKKILAYVFIAKICGDFLELPKSNELVNVLFYRECSFYITIRKVYTVFNHLVHSATCEQWLVAQLAEGVTSNQNMGSTPQKCRYL